jgi:LysM repeat protein
VQGDWKRYVAPAAFLLAVTIVVVLVHAGLNSGRTAGTTRPQVPTIPRKTVASTSPTTTRKKPASSARFYTVVAGDTFGVISSKTGVPVARIQELNPNVQSTALFIGQKLRIR